MERAVKLVALGPTIEGSNLFNANRIKMFLFSRPAVIKSSIRITTHMKGFYLTNGGFITPKELRIRNFILRTDNNVNDQIQTDSYLFQRGYRIIYKFPHKKFMMRASYVGCFYFSLIFYYIYNENKNLQFQDTKEEEDPTVSEELKYEYDSHSKPKQSDISSEPVYIERVFWENPGARFLIAVAMLYILFVVRKRTVLEIYRHDNEYITTFFKPLSFNRTFTHHRAKECYYYPKKKILQYKLLGKRIGIFPEHFINDDEKNLYFERKND